MKRARALCLECERNVAAVKPRHGDGSVFVYRRHRTEGNGDAPVCDSSRTIVPDKLISDWGTYGYGGGR